MPAAPPTATEDHDTHDDNNPLRSEQRYLAAARAELARMREHTMSLEAGLGSGDRVSSDYLAFILWQRAQSLIDDPSTALFFGRLDADADDSNGDDSGGEPQPDDDGRPHRWYIGRRHVSDDVGDPVVVDWRAPISTPFYRASQSEPMGIRRRRRFGIDHGQITAYEDEILASEPGETGGSGTSGSGTSQILAKEIERPRVGPMRDIVATIQPEQDTIVRADVTTTICIQGAPGTGKTAVGLHRAAWLLYTFRERLSRTGVLVVGPNRAFLDHIGAVLPALGEIEVRHTTAADLSRDAAAVAIRAEDLPSVAAIKGDARMAQVLHRAVWARIGSAGEALVVPRGSRRWRVPAYEVQEILDELVSRGVRYTAARAMFPQRLAHAVLVSMERSGDAPDDRVQDSVARSAPVKAYVKDLWPALDASQVLFDLWRDADTLARAADGILSAQEQEALLWRKAPRSKGSARWTPADVALLDEATDLIERAPRIGHVILDEAQDLSPMQLRAVGRRADTGSMTVLGDIAQGTTPWATTSWEESLEHLGKPEAQLEVLRRGFRVPARVIDFAARLLPSMARGLEPPESVRSNPGRFDIVATADLLGSVQDQVREAADTPGSIGVIVPDSLATEVSELLRRGSGEMAGVDVDEVDGQAHAEEGLANPAQVQVVHASATKGLEFDQVIVVEPARIAREEGDERSGLRRLYVVLTRAVSGLTVVHAEPLPEALAAPGTPMPPA